MCSRKVLGPAVLGLAALGLALLLPRPATAQQVYKNISSAKLEQILTDLGITYKKSNGNREGIHFYDYTRNNFKIRLHNYDGKDLWIDALWSDPLTMEDCNRWNVKAKFSRAVLLNQNGKNTVSLENQFDVLGGCTDPFVRQFITRFDTEVGNFASFIQSTLPR
jgi:hypothetical protein